MKHTGMLFKGALVRAILEGRKTQTRRIVKPAPAADQTLQPITTETGLVYARSFEKSHFPETRPIRWDSPAGKPGDLIYVRETWQHANWPLGPYQEGTPTFYRADYLHESDPDYADAERTIRRNWLPSIHMPKHAARIWLEITGVRVERLQDISPSDAIKDGGLHRLPATGRFVINKGDQYFGGATHNPIELFREIWKSTGADWTSNPWVWVYEFKRIEPPALTSQ